MPCWYAVLSKPDAAPPSRASVYSGIAVLTGSTASGVGVDGRCVIDAR